jgi:hypothetical protein
LFLISSVPVAAIQSSIRAQARPKQNPPKPGEQREENNDTPKFDSKTMLEANQKGIKKSIERLFQLASELKNEVEKTDSVKVLSVAMLKKAEDIEKLAKEIRSRAIG